MNLKNDTYHFNNINIVNIILGKNGSGKSTALKSILKATDDNENELYIEYITPERGGHLNYDPNVDSNISNNLSYLKNSRTKNQLESFKQQTISKYQILELSILRTIANEKRDDKSFSFAKYISQINALLDNIEIKSFEKSFKIYKKGTDEVISSENISSGESELIALAIECLAFQHSNSEGKIKLLLLDEPDVHLHPDLQIKFMRFIYCLAIESGADFKVILSTHSTSLLGAIQNTSHLNVGFMSTSQHKIDFKPITDIFQKFLPVFGAHPLSTVFNEAPIFLVEGDDDERIWQQAIRTSMGKIKLYPCVCGDVTQIGNYEKEIKDVINSIYDNPKAYSLRDRDESDESDLLDEDPIIKFRLKCYSAENLLLTNEVLAKLNVSWIETISKMNEWVIEKKITGHPQLNDMENFQASGYDRKTLKVKFLRNLLLGIIGSAKPWEVIVGQTIAEMRWSSATDYTIDGSIYNYLGKKMTETILISS